VRVEAGVAPGARERGRRGRRLARRPHRRREQRAAQNGERRLGRADPAEAHAGRDALGERVDAHDAAVAVEAHEPRLDVRACSAARAHAYAAVIRALLHQTEPREASEFCICVLPA
jgi:hypothetical protein